MVRNERKRATPSFERCAYARTGKERRKLRTQARAERVLLAWLLVEKGEARNTSSRPSKLLPQPEHFTERSLARPETPYHRTARSSSLDLPPPPPLHKYTLPVVTAQAVIAALRRSALTCIVDIEPKVRCHQPAHLNSMCNNVRKTSE